MCHVLSTTYLTYLTLFSAVPVRVITQQENRVDLEIAKCLKPFDVIPISAESKLSNVLILSVC